MKQHPYRKGFQAPGQPPHGRKVTVSESNTLLPFLFDLLKEQSKTSVKALLAHNQIAVNGIYTTQFDTPLEPGDEVFISHDRSRRVTFNNPLLNIIWEDDFVIVVNKREGLLSVSTQKVHERTAFHILADYLKRKDPRNKLFVLHRLDRDTSGLMMFAKTRAVQEKMQSNWNEMITERTYVAVVEGRPERDSDIITTQLKENAEARVYVVAEGGKDAITRYRVLRSNGTYSLLELNLETGRKNQIRAQMEYIGHPIAGDFKYGAETSPAGRVMLHAQKLYFIHPETGEEMKFDTRIPDAFKAIAGKINP